jgi:hypothetical protein
MADLRRARDLELLDAVDAVPREVFEGSVWRVVREDRDPVLGYAGRGRWDNGTFDVLYTALESDGALAEMYFHLSRQPVFPSKIRFKIYEIRFQLSAVLSFNELRDMVPLGVDPSRYTEILYDRCQEIGDAANFLGADGIVVPNARWECRNLIAFTDRIDPSKVEVGEARTIDWNVWRDRR